MVKLHRVSGWANVFTRVLIIRRQEGQSQRKNVTVEAENEGREKEEKKETDTRDLKMPC